MPAASFSSKAIWLFFAVSLVVLGLGCGDDGGGGSGGLLGSGGGGGGGGGSGNYLSQPVSPDTNATITNGNLIVFIPAGALNNTTTIQIGIPASPPAFPMPAGYAKVGSTYECKPSGISFNYYVDIIIHYTDQELAQHSENTLVIATYDSPNQAPVALSDILIDYDNNQIYGYADHFSYFVLLISTE